MAEKKSFLILFSCTDPDSNWCTLTDMMRPPVFYVRFLTASPILFLLPFFFYVLFSLFFCLSFTLACESFESQRSDSIHFGG